MESDALVGRLLDVVSRRSEGGYVLIRYSRKKGQKSPHKWWIAIRRGNQEWNNSGETIGMALEKVLNERLLTSHANTYVEN